MTKYLNGNGIVVYSLLHISNTHTKCTLTADLHSKMKLSLRTIRLFILVTLAVIGSKSITGMKFDSIQNPQE